MEKSGEFEEGTSIYRHIQLIASLCNDIQQKQMLPALIVGCTFFFAISLAFLVQISFSIGNLSIIILMLVQCVDSAFFIVLSLSTMATVFKESQLATQKIKAYLSMMADGKAKKWIRTFLKSCGVIKMKLGGNNFVEELTPLNCMSHGLQIAVQIILLWRNH